MVEGGWRIDDAPPRNNVTFGRRFAGKGAPSAPCRPRRCRLDRVVAAAEALTVVRVERCAAILDLDLVVGEHPMPRRSLAAAPLTHHRLAPPTCTPYDDGAPLFELRRVIDVIGPLRGRLEPTCVDSSKAGSGDP